MNKLSDLTAKIVEVRKESRSKFVEKEKRLLKIKEVLSIIQDTSASSLWATIVSENGIQQEWNELQNKYNSFKIKYQDFMSDTGRFYLAKSRADRTYVNVGTVGVTQEGKSEFNSKITNLDRRILPIGGGALSCTTARINIINGNSPDGKSDIVRVHYYSVNEFANLIYSYLLELGASNDSYKDLCTIKTKDMLKIWINQNRHEIELSTEIGKGNLSGRKDALLKYFKNKNIDQYIDRLDNSYDDYTFDELKENKDRAEKYYSSVSYFLNPDDKEPKFTSYATKKAEVFHSFKVGNEDPINNLQFLDTPGIGEDKPGLEKILAKSVSADLDIIMVIRAARSDVQGDPTRTLLIPQLRSLLHKRPKSQQSLYFILNAWDQASPDTGEMEKKAIKNQLEINQDYDKIILDDSHYKVINILKDYEILPDGDRDSNAPIHRYLLDIFKELIPNIRNIDEEYFKEAEAIYDEIMTEYKEITSRMTDISYKLPSDDLSQQIDAVLVDSANSWKDKCAQISDKEIIGEIKYDLEKFCTQPTGNVLFELLGLQTDGIDNFDQEDDNYDFIEDTCLKNEVAINKAFDYPAYQAGAEFKCYSEFKEALLNELADTIFKRINVEKAQEALDETKKNLANVLITKGKLGFVTEDAKVWWSEMANLLSQENHPDELVKIFANFSTFTIDAKLVLGASVDKVISVSRHADNFGDPGQYYFNDFKNAKEAFIHSLLCIEKHVQDLIIKDVYKEQLSQYVSSFSKNINQIRELITFGDQEKKTKLRNAWEHFYRRHAKEIFANSDSERKQALISYWNKFND